MTNILVMVIILLFIAVPPLGSYELRIAAGRSPEGPAEGNIPSPSEVKKAEELRTIWSYKTGGGIYASPLIADKKVFVGSKDGHMYALSVANGELLWRFKTNGEVTTTPVIDGSVIYFGSKDGHVYAVSEGDGRLLWKFKTGGKIASSPRIEGGVLYVGSNDLNLYAINTKSGKPLWSSRISDNRNSGIYSSPAFAAGVVYIAVKDTAIKALDIKSGKPIWLFHTGSANYSTPVISKGIIYVGSYDMNLYAIAGDGSLRWKRVFTDWLYSSPTVHEAVVYAASKDGELAALDAENGNVIWSKSLSHAVSSSLVVTGKNMGLLGTEGGYIHTVNLKTGETAIVKKLDSGIHSTPVVSEDGLYLSVGTTGGTVYALSRTLGGK